MNGGHLNRRNSIIQRPSDLGYNWKGGIKPHRSASIDVTEKLSPASRKRGRPPKIPRSEKTKTTKSQSSNDPISLDLVSEMDDVESIGSWTMDKSREQSHSREARKRAREKVSDAISNAAMEILIACKDGNGRVDTA